MKICEQGDQIWFLLWKVSGDSGEVAQILGQLFVFRTKRLLLSLRKRRFGRLLFSQNHQGSIFRTFFSGENFGENSAENSPQKMLGKKGIFRGKSFEKSLFQEIPRKVIFRGKKCTKNHLVTL
jgi:hypothetical protein